MTQRLLHLGKGKYGVGENIANMMIGALIDTEQITGMGLTMCSEKRIDDLIESGTLLARNSDFDPTVFRRWKLESFDCLTNLLGTDHYYTKNSKTFVRQAKGIDLLAAYGLLSVVQQLLGDNYT